MAQHKKSIKEYFDYLYSLERSGMKYSLSNITKLLKALGNPHKNLNFIHIAGTNGKGATASFAASILMEHGYKTGLFTSPHILRFNERIRINGNCIPDKYIKLFLDENTDLIRKIKPSFFEVNTALAFKYFYDNKVEIAVIEAGLGGRLDSTNIVKPVVSVITQIGMDHMQYLGNTINKIALEKIGIVKSGIDVIVSDNNAKLKKLFFGKIDKKHLIYLDDVTQFKSVKIVNNGLSFNVILDNEKLLNLYTPLPGKNQSRNAAAAILAAKIFTENSLNVSKIRTGLNNVKFNTGYYGRLEIIKHKGIAYTFDISHNPDGIKAAMDSLKHLKIDTVIFAMMGDKDYKTSVKQLLINFRRIIFTKPEYKRSLEPEILFEFALKNKRRNNQNIYFTNSVGKALKLAKEKAEKSKKILIIGSFFLVSDAVKSLRLEKHFK